MAQIGSTSLLMWHGGINSLLYWIAIAFSIKHLSTNIAPSLSTSHKKQAWPWARYRISKNTWRFWNVKMLSCICILYIWGTSQSMCFDVSVIFPPPLSVPHCKNCHTWSPQGILVSQLAQPLPCISDVLVSCLVCDIWHMSTHSPIFVSLLWTVRKRKRKNKGHKKSDKMALVRSRKIYFYLNLNVSPPPQLTHRTWITTKLIEQICVSSIIIC